MTQTENSIFNIYHLILRIAFLKLKKLYLIMPNYSYHHYSLVKGLLDEILSIFDFG